MTVVVSWVEDGALWVASDSRVSGGDRVDGIAKLIPVGPQAILAWAGDVPECACNVIAATALSATTLVLMAPDTSLQALAQRVARASAAIKGQLSGQYGAWDVDMAVIGRERTGEPTWVGTTQAQCEHPAVGPAPQQIRSGHPLFMGSGAEALRQRLSAQSSAQPMAPFLSLMEVIEDTATDDCGGPPCLLRLDLTGGSRSVQVVEYVAPGDTRYILGQQTVGECRGVLHEVDRCGKVTPRREPGTFRRAAPEDHAHGRPETVRQGFVPDLSADEPSGRVIFVEWREDDGGSYEFDSIVQSLRQHGLATADATDAVRHMPFDLDAPAEFAAYLETCVRDSAEAIETLFVMAHGTDCGLFRAKPSGGEDPADANVLTFEEFGEALSRAFVPLPLPSTAPEAAAEGLAGALQHARAFDAAPARDVTLILGVCGAMSRAQRIIESLPPAVGRLVGFTGEVANNYVTALVAVLVRRDRQTFAKLQHELEEALRALRMPSDPGQVMAPALAEASAGLSRPANVPQAARDPAADIGTGSLVCFERRWFEAWRQDFELQ